MPVEPWQGYMPGVNAGRYELGTGPTTWVASAEMWMTFGAMVVDSMAVFAAQLGVMGINWMGSAPVGMAAAASEFMEWLGEMETIAIANAGACTAVAVAYAAGQGSMIPTPAVNANRVAEFVAEATNFLEINRGTIVMLNTEYAQFWGQNAMTMMTYDDAVTAATIPKPVRPQPPLASLSQAGSALGDAATTAATQGAIGAASKGAMSGLVQSVSATSEGAGAPSAMSSEMSSLFGQFASAPSQLFGQVGSLGSSLSSPAQSLMSPFQSLISSMGGGLGAQDASAFGLTGPAASGFDGIAAAGAAGGGIAPVGGFGGGLGGSMMPHGAFMGSSGPTPRVQQVFSGVAPKESELAVAPGAAGSGGGLYGGGGMAPHAAGAGAAQSAGGVRKHGDGILAVNSTPAVLAPEDREAEEMFRDQ